MHTKTSTFNPIDEVKNRNYKYCTIDAGDYGKLLATVKYRDKAWGPDRVKLGREWVSIDDFEDIVEFYSCDDYRSEI